MADVRTKDAIKGVNDALADRQIRHAVFMERFKTSTQNKVLNLLGKEVYPDIQEQLDKRLKGISGSRRVSGATRTARLQELLDNVEDTIKKGMVKANKTTAAELKGFAESEGEFQTKLFKDEIPDELNLTFAEPDPQSLRAIVESEPFQGRLLKEWFDDLGTDTQRTFEKALRVGFAEGESNDDIVRRITRSGGPINMNRRQVKSIVRTATSHVANSAREGVYRENSSILKNIKWLATLDNRTCPICMALDQQLFPLDGGRRPPAHHQCRCTTTPVTKSWKELGFNKKELSPSTRASMNGQVSEQLSYGQWLKRQPQSVQNDALGKTRASLFRGGKVKIDSFTQDGKVLNLSQLRAREGLSSG